MPKRFQSAGTGLTLDTAALAKYKDIVDLSIGDTDFITDDAIIDTAFREAKAGTPTMEIRRVIRS